MTTHAGNEFKAALASAAEAHIAAMEALDRAVDLAIDEDMHDEIKDIRKSLRKSHDDLLRFDYDISALDLPATRQGAPDADYMDMEDDASEARQRGREEAAVGHWMEY